MQPPVELKHPPLKSIAIAGAWGYIGQRFLNAAMDLGLDIAVYDPFPPPEHLDTQRVAVMEDEDSFYKRQADVFHLALHPQHRAPALARLLERTRKGEAITVLCEKPVARPEEPSECEEVLAISREPGFFLFYDFPELFDPQTHHIHEFLTSFREVTIDEVWMQHSKDREDPANPRNYKVMVPIQYQESVHCIAFMLDLLARCGSGISPWGRGVEACGTSRPYQPPNPERYAHVVDGVCSGELSFGTMTVHIDTNFKRGAPFTKQRRIRGRGDGKPFEIIAEYLEGHKWLRINGVQQPVAEDSNSYACVLKQLWKWRTGNDQEELNCGVFPNARLARDAYFVSALLWNACFLGRNVFACSLEEACSAAMYYQQEMECLPHYA